MDTIKLEKIVLLVGDKQIELSLDEARDLKDLLKDLLGDETKKEVYIRYPYYPYISVYPTWTWETGTPLQPNSGTITITSNSMNSHM